MKQKNENIESFNNLNVDSILDASKKTKSEKVVEIDVSKLPPRTLVELLTINGQTHLLEAIKNCPEEKRKDFVEEINSIDWSSLKNVFTPVDMSDAKIEMSKVISLEERKNISKKLEKIGKEAYKNGEVGVLLVAGGQGTRLGYDGPKGCFESLSISKKTLYQIHAEKIIYASKKYGKIIPFLIMTSPDTDALTREFFKENNYFGMNKNDVFFFCQSMTATCDLMGRALLASSGQLLKNPDGHGGCYTAFMRSGAMEYLEKRGIKTLVYIQVDNILAPIDDAVLVGLARSENADIVTKVLKKASPQEKVGHLVSIHGKDHIVEYVDVSKEQLELKDENGEIIFNWGSPAMHAFSVDFFRKLKNENVHLPFHRSKKIVKAYVDGKVQDTEAYKHEKFIFDLLPLAKKQIGLEISREDEFSPIKNMTGVDSIETALELYSNRNKRWLERVGVDTSKLSLKDYIEIDIAFAPTFEDFEKNWDNRFSEITKSTTWIN
ncbi:MAG: UTP--glucose-1-phosphate uridylyltransferase [Bdellovibrionota bacterium]